MLSRQNQFSGIGRTRSHIAWPCCTWRNRPSGDSVPEHTRGKGDSQTVRRRCGQNVTPDGGSIAEPPSGV